MIWKSIKITIYSVWITINMNGVRTIMGNVRDLPTCCFILICETIFIPICDINWWFNLYINFRYSEFDKSAIIGDIQIVIVIYSNEKGYVNENDGTLMPFSSNTLTQLFPLSGI